MANFRHFSAVRKDGTEDLLRIYSTLVTVKNLHSFQYPLEGDKCLSGYFKFLISMHPPYFCF
jgi:hypothetical protein